jgi:SAM-dependent methyltransferase
MCAELLPGAHASPARPVPAAELADVMLRRRRREQHSDPRSIALLSRLGIPPEATCLEVGAGLGGLARWMAATLVPRGFVRATEVRPELMKLPSSQAPRNLRMTRHDIVREALPERSYDLIHARFVLEHLPERDAVLAALAAHLSPGGWLVIEDALIAPGLIEGPEPFAAVMTSFAANRASLGSDYAWASGLPEGFQRLGLADISAQRVADVFVSGSGLGIFWAAVLHQDRGAVSASGHAAGGLVDEVLALLCNGPAWFVGPQVIQCAGRREDMGRQEDRA